MGATFKIKCIKENVKILCGWKMFKISNVKVAVGREKESVPFMQAVDKEWKEKYGAEM